MRRSLLRFALYFTMMAAGVVWSSNRLGDYDPWADRTDPHRQRYGHGNGDRGGDRNTNPPGGAPTAE
jgi:hypothetical protein